MVVGRASWRLGRKDSRFQNGGCSAASQTQRPEDWEGPTAIQLPHITRRQHSVRRSRAEGFSDLVSYWGVMLLRREAQVQHASSIVLFG